MVRETSGKSLGHEANERLREIVRSFVDRDFGGNKTAAAKRLGVSQSLVQEFLDGSRGAGVKLISAVAAYTGRPMDEVLGRAPAPPAPARPAPPVRAPVAPAAPPGVCCCDGSRSGCATVRRGCCSNHGGVCACR